jgi:hypothetical protein
MSTKHDECSSQEEVCVKLEKAGSLMRGGIGPGRMEGRQLSILADQKKTKNCSQFVDFPPCLFILCQTFIASIALATKLLPIMKSEICPFIYIYSFHFFLCFCSVCAKYEYIYIKRKKRW